MVNLTKAEIKELVKDSVNECMQAVTKKIDESIKQLSQEFNSKLDKFTTEITNISTRLLTAETTIQNQTTKINTNDEELQSHGEAINTIRDKYDEQEKLIDKLFKQVDEQIDRGMRETVTINGIKGDGKETWDQSKTMVAEKLAELSAGKYEASFFANAIVRAHQGKGKSTRTLFVKFSNESVIKEAKFVATMARKGVFVNQLRSPLVRQRIGEALGARKTLMSQNANWKVYVNDQVELMVKKPNETKYTKIKQF